MPLMLNPDLSLNEAQRRLLLVSLRFYEGLHNALTPTTFDPTRPLPPWTSELSRRAETQVECRDLLRCDADVLGFLQKVTAAQQIMTGGRQKERLSPLSERLQAALHLKKAVGR